jgi:hypothetical protein
VVLESRRIDAFVSTPTSAPHLIGVESTSTAKVAFTFRFNVNVGID